MFFFHAENFFVVLCGLVEIFDVDCDMPDPWFFHVSLLIFYVITKYDRSTTHFLP